MPPFARMPLALLLVVAACATPPRPAEDPEPERAFIKLANRQMALVVFWRSGAPSEAFREQFERTLARNLKTSYRCEVGAHGREGPPRPLDSGLLYTLAREGVDDVVVVDVRPTEGPEGPLSAAAWVEVLANGQRLHALRLSAVRGTNAKRPAPERLADLVSLELSKRWTDPGRAPPLDPLTIAERIAKQGDCRRAAPIYETVLNKRRSGAALDLRRIGEAQRRYDKCLDTIAADDAIIADRKATFEIRLQAEDVSGPIRAALQASLSDGDFERVVERLTSKPVVLTVKPNRIVLGLRYHRDRYTSATKGKIRLERGYPVVHLEPYVPVLKALIALVERTLDRLPPYEQRTLEGFPMTLRLQKLPRDRIELDFAELDDRVLLPDRVRVKLAGRPEVEVASILPGVTRSHRLVLGPPRTTSGALTEHGLVFEFFELEP